MNKGFLTKMTKRLELDKEAFGKVKGMFEAFDLVTRKMVEEYLGLGQSQVEKLLAGWRECGWIERAYGRAGKWAWRLVK